MPFSTNGMDENPLEKQGGYETEEKMPRESAWKEFLRFALIALAIVIPFRLFVAQPFIVSGASMSPTFETGEYLIVDELTYRFEEPKRGDVIILKKPSGGGEYLIKRIVGLPGDTVVIKNGAVTVKSKGNPDGEKISEPYVKNKKEENLEIAVGNNEYFVMGDNRPISLDSRYIGAIPKENIVGRAWARVLPVKEMALFPGAVEN